MVEIKLEEGYRVTLPREVRGELHVGDQLIVTTDSAGRIVMTSAGQIQKVLRETFGSWANRDDQSTDGVAYVDEIRSGTRLDETD